VTAQRKRAHRRGPRFGVLHAALLLAVLGAAAAIAGVSFLQGRGVTPRLLGPYIDKRASGHNPVITGSGQWLGAFLAALDRGAPAAPGQVAPLKLGVQPVAAPTPAPAGQRRLVADADGLRGAIAAAAAGDVITLLPGTYRVRGNVAAVRAGTADAPIVVRAEQPGSAVVELEAGEGFVVSAPYWRFENLDVRGACAVARYCEHAFHVVGDAHHFAAVNNRIGDFNAHFKINGERGRFPDHGLIEGNTIANGAPRATTQPVTPIDLVAASDWIVRGNLIADFVKTDGDRISYGAFAKGAGARNLFERNVVLCEQRLRGYPGARIGLSFGGGGTGKPYCRDGRCISEQEQGTMRANLVASCSDAGMYVNAAAGTRIVDNTLVDTGGIDVRFPESSAQLDGNLVDGPIFARNGGLLRLGDNLQTPIWQLYAGRHPQRALFLDAGGFDFGWREPAPARAPAAPGPDLCGVARPARPRYGAFEDFGACLAR
jgi:hypothetical protein